MTTPKDEKGAEPLTLAAAPSEPVAPFDFVDHEFGTVPGATKPMGMPGGDEKGAEPAPVGMFHRDFRADGKSSGYLWWHDGLPDGTKLYATPPGELDSARVREALAELVACKDLKERVERARTDPAMLTETYLALRDDYARRQPLAWEAARAALKDPQPALRRLT